jgi:hypothetical protein
MTEPQVWVLIGVFAAAMVGVLGIVTTSLNRTLDSKFEALDSKFAAFDSKMSGKFETIDAKLAHMDRDIQALSRHVFGTDPR